MRWKPKVYVLRHIRLHGEEFVNSSHDYFRLGLTCRYCERHSLTTDKSTQRLDTQCFIQHAIPSLVNCTYSTSVVIGWTNQIPLLQFEQAKQQSGVCTINQGGG
jgi:hypothetical protein